MRARRILIVLLLAIVWSASVMAQVIDDVIVETYYVADADDATDTIGVAGGIPQGAKTYRVYIDLAAGCALRAIYGSEGHPLIIQSTALVLNHLDRGRTYGHEINNSALDEGTVALDSWLSLGAASNQRAGVQKLLDPDGSVVGGANNDGGSAELPDGLLANDGVEVGIPLTTSDGLMPLTGAALPPNFIVTGDDPAMVFKDSTLASGFVSVDCRVGSATPGTTGPTAENQLLVLQITTVGELTFELNVEVECGGELVRFVARDTLLAPDETPNGLLVYPPQCGCTDPNFLEYDPSAGCDDGSCATAFVFGCMDPAACNYDPAVNYNIDALCCYGPTDCNGLDVTVVCPDVGLGEIQAAAFEVDIAPNPTNGQVVVLASSLIGSEVRCTVQDVLGRPVRDFTTAMTNNGIAIELADLSPGGYLLQVEAGGRRAVERIIKY